MTTFAAEFKAAEAAKTKYQRHGLQPDALRDWLTAEVVYLEARGINLFMPPSSPPQDNAQTRLFAELAALLYNTRHKHFHALVAVA